MRGMLRVSGSTFYSQTVDPSIVHSLRSEREGRVRSRSEENVETWTSRISQSDRQRWRALRKTGEEWVIVSGWQSSAENTETATNAKVGLPHSILKKHKLVQAFGFFSFLKGSIVPHSVASQQNMHIFTLENLAHNNMLTHVWKHHAGVLITATRNVQPRFFFFYFIFYLWLTLGGPMIMPFHWVSVMSSSFTRPQLTVPSPPPFWPSSSSSSSRKLRGTTTPRHTHTHTI